MSFSEQVSPR